MKSQSIYHWQGHNICIEASASPQCLWLNCQLEVIVDNRKIDFLRKRYFCHAKTHFKFQHLGRNFKGEVISSGFPFTPVISQSTIIDDTVIGHSQMLVKKRILTYILLSAIALGLHLF